MEGPGTLLKRQVSNSDKSDTICQISAGLRGTIWTKQAKSQQKSTRLVLCYPLSEIWISKPTTIQIGSSTWIYFFQLERLSIWDENDMDINRDLERILKIPFSTWLSTWLSTWTTKLKNFYLCYYLSDFNFNFNL